jgi:DNA polymerase III alpha subunit
MSWFLQNLKRMKTNKFGEMIFDEQDVFNFVMSGHDVTKMNTMIVDPPLDIETAALILGNIPAFKDYNEVAKDKLSVEEWDHRNQSEWFMPDEYKQLDIAKLVLDLCKSDEELQRVGEELLLYQERNLFDLLRYLKYLVDVMRSNHLIWGVGRGSSVASYILYKLGIHRIDSLFYNLDCREFLR